MNFHPRESKVNFLPQGNQTPWKAGQREGCPGNSPQGKKALLSPGAHHPAAPGWLGGLPVVDRTSPGPADPAAPPPRSPST